MLESNAKPARHRADRAIRAFVAVAVVGAALAQAASAVAAPPAPVPMAAAATATADPGSSLRWSLGGVAWVWGLNQHGFLLGKDAALDDADYVVHNFRLLGKVENDHVGVTLRADVAEGWWGVDNDPDVGNGVATAPDGKVSGTTTTNPYALFRNKGNNYPFHVDWAWLWLKVPKLPLKVSAGRQPFAVGNRLVLDQAAEGVRADIGSFSGFRATASWIKLHEGGGAVRNPVGLLMNDNKDGRDGDIYGLSLFYQTDVKATHAFELFALHYRDGNTGTAMLPQGLGYGLARFQPQVSSLTAAGLHARGALPVAKGLLYNLEVDVLSGRDDFDNADFAGNAIDKNDGTLFGYNAYLDVQQKLDAGIPLDLKLTLGLGSGDPDKTKGAGNVNRIQTMGFFALTNVWEDSVMPDVEGISPQGLGSPVSRGYRELENTTVAMLTVGAEVVTGLRLEAAYAYLQATQPVQGWDANGPTSDSSSALGSELDVNVKWTLRPGLQLIGLYGWFFTGKAAALLINGNDKHTAMAWEAKHVLQWAF